MAIKRNVRPTEDQIRRHVYDNIRLGLTQVTHHLPQNTPVALCAGGQSLKNHLKEIRQLQLEGAEVVCVGNSANMLAKEGIKVNGHIMMDGVERNKEFVVPIKDCRYFVASQCDPKVFEKLTSHKYVYIWHAGGPKIEEILIEYYGGPFAFLLIPGGSYITLRAITLLNILGYNWIHVFGFDSCYLEDEHHAYSQPNADHYKVEDVTVGGKDFRCTYWMLDQATQFVDSLKRGGFGSARLAVHGDGMIAHMIKTNSEPTWRLD